MLKRLFLLAGVVATLAVVGSAAIPTPPCAPCVVNTAR